MLMLWAGATRARGWGETGGFYGNEETVRLAVS